jgi:cell division protein FtsB
LEKKKVIFLVLAILLLGLIFIPGYLKTRALLRENRQLERRIAEISQANKKMSQEYERLRSDPIYLEKVAREKLGVVREGEVIYQVLPRKQD